MKKIFSIALVALFLFSSIGIGHAEFSKTAVTGTSYTDSQVFLSCYYAPRDANRPQLTKNSVCVLATGSTLAATNSTMGVYVTTTNNRQLSNIVGVADEDIASGTVGRICIKGAHLAILDQNVTNTDIANNVALSTADEDGRVNTTLTASTAGVIVTGSILGIKFGDVVDGSGHIWVYVNPQILLQQY